MTNDEAIKRLDHVIGIGDNLLKKNIFYARRSN